MSIKDIVRAPNVATFVKYFDQQLWYEIEYTEDGESKTYIFPVPIEDIGMATFLAEDKAMLFMRYVRKYMQATEG